MRPLKDDDSSPYTIAAGGKIDIAAAGRYVRCLEADGLLEVSFNNGSKTFFGAGLERRLPEQSPDFEQFTVFNPNGAAVSCVLSWGYGTLKDDRLSASGNLNVITPAGTALKTDDDEAQAKLDALIALLQNDADQRKGLTTLAGATQYQQIGAGTTTVIAGGANTGGGVIRFGQTFIYGSTARRASIRIGGKDLLVSQGTSGEHSPLTIRDMDIPAGVDVELVCDATQCEAFVWYEDKS